MVNGILLLGAMLVCVIASGDRLIIRLAMVILIATMGFRIGQENPKDDV